MDIAKSLKDAETALRDFIGLILKRNFGSNWEVESGIDPIHLENWKIKKDQQLENDGPGIGEENILLYAPLEDLIPVIQDNWEGELQQTFHNLDNLLTYLRLILYYKNHNQMRGELFVYQKHLILGISGEIRNKIATFRSILDTGKEGFPRIEYVKDNYGNLWTPGKPAKVKTNQTLRVGDILEFVVQASDPLEDVLNYRIHGQKWQAGNILILKMEEQHISRNLQVHITIKSARKFHANPMGYDDRVAFQYQVLPKSD